VFDESRSTVLFDALRRNSWYIALFLSIFDLLNKYKYMFFKV